MRIISFEYQDADGWTLEPMKLDGFNLLVGLSGAGKTRIVQAIERVCKLALGTDDGEEIRGSGSRPTTFAVKFEHAGVAYTWEAELERGLRSLLDMGASKPPLLRTERITRGDARLVERDPASFLFNGHAIPLLDRARSAIAILKEDPAMKPVHAAFSRCVLATLTLMPRFGLAAEGALDEQRGQYRSVEDLGADFSQELHNKAGLFQTLFPDAFSEIEGAFREAFPLVEKLTVRYEREPEAPGVQVMSLEAKETGIARRIPFDAMSSGMRRYLSFLIHLSFAPAGTVVLVDELESSFGVNCLPAATRFLLRRAPDLQLILTSHHPYIIEQIPTDCWKIVTRKGSHVRVLDASAIPALEESRSHLDRFTRLINLPEYTESIQAA